ncbi:sigma factor [Solibacillus daqui]|uniref:sigma factor n=1 Tax=Solibacillus daqui TaxID=2912187 RepID=UPI002365A175|nr:sigma factor [Solibacillus daqui]
MQGIDERIGEFEYLILRVIAKYKLFQDKENYMQIGRLAIWKAAKEFDETKGNFEMYAYMLIKFAILREFNGNLKVTEHETATEDNKLSYLCDTASDQLPFTMERPDWYYHLFPDHQHLIELLYYEGYSIRDAAKLEGISYEVMKKRRSKMLKNVRTMIQKKDGQAPIL